MPVSTSEWLFPVLAIVWFAMCACLSLMSGWFYLGARFKSDEQIDGERFCFRSGALGWRAWPVGYRNCLFVTVGSRGFAVSVLFPFRFLHPRLVIPWSAVERCEDVKFWFMKCVAVRIAGFDRRILFRGDLGAKIFAMWNQSQGKSQVAGNRR
jgi:hypothetical protein